MKYMINEEYEVQGADKERTFVKGDKREDYADAWRNTGNVILVGLPGSGKRVLAEALIGRTGSESVFPETPEKAVEYLGGQGRIIVLNDSLVEDQSVQPIIHGAGKVFYLMADTKVLSSRVAEAEGVEDKDSLWREMSARLAVMEPLFYTVLHFILQAGEGEEAVLENAMEKIAF